MINDGFWDMSTRHDFPHLQFKGKKLLATSNEEQNFEYTAPSAPTVVIANGGSLVENTNYKGLVTFVDSNGYESFAGTATGAVTGTAANKTISWSSIPTSDESLVTARRLYVSKDDNGGGTYGKYFFDQEIADNTTTTATTTSEPDTNGAEPPDFNMIRKIEGNLFLESKNREIFYKPIEELRSLFPKTWEEGPPRWCSYAGNERFWLYPKPNNDAQSVSFYYYRHPKRGHYLTTSIPEFDIGAKEVIRSYVRWRGHDFKDRDGQIEKKNIYIETFSDYVSRNFGSNRVQSQVRDVIGDSDGWLD